MIYTQYICSRTSLPDTVMLRVRVAVVPVVKGSEVMMSNLML